jgi:hypothetical protein
MYITVRKYIIMRKRWKLSLWKKNFKRKISIIKLSPKNEGVIFYLGPPFEIFFQRGYTPPTPPCETLFERYFRNLLWNFAKKNKILGKQEVNYVKLMNE